VASKAAALALLVRVAVGFGTVIPHSAAAAGEPATHGAIVLTSAVEGYSAQSPDSSAADTSVRMKALAPVRDYIALLVAVISAVTCTFGNLAAYGQTNIKRLMAYSTIAHAGYIMMPVAAAVALTGVNTSAAEAAYCAVPFYVGLYLFMNLGAFAIIALVRNVIRSEEIADYGGLVRVAPGVVVCMAAILFSLIGLPPLAGFAAKYVAFAALVQAMEVPTFRWLMLTLLVVGGLNTVLSLFYYLRVVKAMTIDPEPAERRPVEFPLVSLRGAYVVAITLPVLILGLFWDRFYHWLTAGAGNLMQ
jgi:NADH-quinone oxidoreductase subunit N